MFEWFFATTPITNGCICCFLFDYILEKLRTNDALERVERLERRVHYNY